jgi:2-(1,2-epoxy-1,2-dihydrophenyl)acetyl-CoA isomerase
MALGRAKRLIDTAMNHSLEEQLEEERQAIIETSTSNDFREGLSALVNKKGKPNFGGR